jgi:hypothetical protein
MSLDDVQERRDEREMYFQTSRDTSASENYRIYRALTDRLRGIASQIFRGEVFDRLMQEHPDAGCFLVLGSLVIGYGKYLSEACQMAQSRGIQGSDCLTIFREDFSSFWTRPSEPLVE